MDGDEFIITTVPGDGKYESGSTARLRLSQLCGGPPPQDGMPVPKKTDLHTPAFATGIGKIDLAT